VNTIGEQDLRRRLRADIDTVRPAPAPVGAVIRRGRAVRARRRAAAASGVTAVAAAVAMVLSVQAGANPASPATPAGSRLAARSGDAARVLDPPSRPHGNVVASGVIAGTSWRLSVRDIADPGARCLPAIMLNGSDADLLSTTPGTQQAMTDVAFLSVVPGQPGAGYAAIQVAPAVTRLVAYLRNGTRLLVRPVTVRACGQRLHLAGFGYPGSGVARITASSGAQFTTQATPPASMFGSASGTPGTAGRLVPGVWAHMWGAGDVTASGTIGSGRLSSGSWHISVLLGAGGECYTAAAFDGRVATRAIECVPIEPPPATASLQRVRLAPGTGLTGYAGLVSPRAAYLVASLSGGGTTRVRPAQIAGRGYVALAVPAGRALARLALYDRSGHPFATINPAPAAG